MAEFGMIHALVNNAGIFFNAPFEQTTDEQYDRIMAVNVKSVFLVSQIVIRHWLQREDIKGTIVNLASIGAAVAFVDSSAYCTTKGAVATLTRCIALEYGPQRDPCQFNGARHHRHAHAAQRRKITNAIGPTYNHTAASLGRSRRDVADVALFLASDESRYITGEMIFVDGGWMLN